MIFHRNSNQIQRRKQHLKIQSWRQTEVRTLLAIAIWRNTWKTCRFARSAGSLPLATNWYFDAVLEHLSFQFDQKGLCLPDSFLVVWCYMSWSFGFRRECHWPVHVAKKQQHDSTYRENIERRWQITDLFFWRARIFLWILAQSGMSTWTIWRWKDVEFWNVPPLCHSPFDNLGWLSPKCSSTGSGSTHAISEIFPWQIEPPHWKMAKTSRCKDAKHRQTSPTVFLWTVKQLLHKVILDIDIPICILTVWFCQVLSPVPHKATSATPQQAIPVGKRGWVGSGPVRLDPVLPCWFVGGTRHEVELNCSRHHMHGLILRRLQQETQGLSCRTSNWNGRI